MQYYKFRQENQLIGEIYKTEIAAAGELLEEGLRIFEPERFKRSLQRAVLRFAYVGGDGKLNLSREAYGRLSSLIASYSPQSRKASIDTIKQIVNSLVGDVSSDTARNVNRILNYNYDQQDVDSTDYTAQARRQRKNIAMDREHGNNTPKRDDFRTDPETGQPEYYNDMEHPNPQADLEFLQRWGSGEISNDHRPYFAKDLKSDLGPDPKERSHLAAANAEADRETRVMRAKRWQYIRSLPPEERAAAEEKMARKQQFAKMANFARKEGKGPLANKKGFEFEPDED